MRVRRVRGQVLEQACAFPEVEQERPGLLGNAHPIQTPQVCKKLPIYFRASLDMNSLFLVTLLSG